jgi:hypothetical protein
LGKLPKGIHLICEAFLNSSLRKREFCLPEGEGEREREESQSSIARFSHTTLKTEEEEEEKQEENNNNNKS